MALQGVAITSVDNTNGAWQYSVDGGSNWTAFWECRRHRLHVFSTGPMPIIGSALFQRRTIMGQSSTHLYRAWDQTTGTVTQTANTTNTGGATAFSTGLVTKTITVTAVNDQPDVTVSNQTINEDAGAQTVTNFATPANGATQLEGSETLAMR